MFVCVSFTQNTSIALAFNPTVVAIAALCRSDSLDRAVLEQYLALMFTEDGAKVLLEKSENLLHVFDQQVRTVKLE